MSTLAQENPGFCWKCQALLNTQYPETLVTASTSTVDRGGKPVTTSCSRLVRTRDPLEVTASNGCNLCLHLWHSLGIPARAALQWLTRATEQGTSPPNIEYLKYIAHYEGCLPFIRLTVKSEKPVPEWQEENYIVTELRLFPEAERAPFFNTEEVRGSTNSDTSRALVADWIDRCIKTHKACNLSVNEATTLPSRVLDISSGTPRLLVVQDSTSPLPYATMSHCWGSHLPLRLLSSNITDLQAEIPVNQLSRSFRDAIQVLKWLGLSYIWIDCLCIIQDSPADWEKESMSMAEVYSNSYCNIAAAHAADGRDGCFVERDPRLVKPVKVDLHWGLNPGSYCPIQERYWQTNVMSAPLNTRAWVCQERYLSPRNLFFGETELYWECCENSASETFPSGLPPEVRVTGKSLDPHVTGAALRRRYSLSATPELDAFTLWDRIVDDYSAGKLTYSEDKLVAISGMASRMQKHTRSEYLAGMWRKHLPYQLLWCVYGLDHNIQRAVYQRPTVYTAPSWSWASIHGTIYGACMVPHADDHEIVLEILDVKVDLVSDVNPFGRVKGGYMRVRGHLARDDVHVQAESPPSRGRFSLMVRDKPVGFAKIDEYVLEAAPATHYGLYYLVVRYNARYEEALNDNVHAVYFGALEGLICQPTSPDTRTELVRIGKFEIMSQTTEFQAACRQYSRGSRQADTTEDSKEWGPRLEITIL